MYGRLLITQRGGDGDTSIDHLISQGAIDVGGSAVVKGDLVTLQMAHDDWTIASTPVSEERFVKTLTNLESKYGVAA